MLIGACYPMLCPIRVASGALGRCGTGATTLADKCGFPASAIVKWDM